MYKQVLHYTLSILSLAAVCLLWKYNVILTIVLLLLSFTLLILQKSKTELFMFLACSFYGAIAEVIAIYFGAWNYSLPNFGGIPIWLPILWGIAAIFMKRLHDHIAYEIEPKVNSNQLQNK